jgi:hypothetical protein
MSRVCRTHWENRYAFRNLLGDSERKRPVGRPRRKREDNIKMDLREIRWGGVESCDSGWGPVQGHCEYNNETSGSITFWESS